MEYKILKVNNIEDEIRWNKIIQNPYLNKLDIYFLPDYLKMNINDTQNEEGIMFYVSEKNFVWVHIFIKKKISNYNEIFSEKPFYDLETAYGYGGPIANTENGKFLKKAQNVYFDWCKNNNILCEFVRFHPLINNQIYFSELDKIIIQRENRYTKLKYISENLVCFNSKVRNKIRKAYKNNLTAEITKKKKDFDEFKILYLQHLDNISAEKFYYFNNNYFEKLSKILENFGFLLVVRNEKKEILGASIFLGFDKTIHYHLTAISKKNQFPGINNFLLLNAYLYAKKNNFEICNLGGGLSNNQVDTLLEFKKSISNSKSDFYIGYKIYDLEIYGKLINLYKSKFPKQFELHSNKILSYRYHD